MRLLPYFVEADDGTVYAHCHIVNHGKAPVLVRADMILDWAFSSKDAELLPEPPAEIGSSRVFYLVRPSQRVGSGLVYSAQNPQLVRPLATRAEKDVFRSGTLTFSVVCHVLTYDADKSDFIEKEVALTRQVCLDKTGLAAIKGRRPDEDGSGVKGGCRHGKGTSDYRAEEPPTRGKRIGAERREGRPACGTSDCQRAPRPSHSRAIEASRPEKQKACR